MCSEDQEVLSAPLKASWSESSSLLLESRDRAVTWHLQYALMAGEAKASFEEEVVAALTLGPVEVVPELTSAMLPDPRAVDYLTSVVVRAVATDSEGQRVAKLRLPLRYAAFHDGAEGVATLYSERTWPQHVPNGLLRPASEEAALAATLPANVQIAAPIQRDRGTPEHIVFTDRDLPDHEVSLEDDVLAGGAL